MKLTINHTLRLVVYITAMVFFDLLRSKKYRLSYLKKFCESLSIYIGGEITANDYRLTISGLYINEMKIIKKAISACLCGITFKFHFPLTLSIRIKHLTIETVHKNVGRKNSNKEPNDEKSSLELQLLLSKGIRLWTSYIKMIYKHSKTEVSSITLIHQKKTLAKLINLSSSNNKITCSIDNLHGLKSRYRLNAVIRNSNIAYSFKCERCTQSDSHNTRNILGNIDLINKNQIIVRAYLCDTVLNHVKICLDKIKIKQIQLFLDIQLLDDKIVVSRNSFTVVNTIKISHHYVMKWNDMDLFSIVIGIQIKPEAILCLIPTLQVERLYALQTDGDVYVKISFAFLWSDPLMHKFNVDFSFDDFGIVAPGVNMKELEREFVFTNKMEYNEDHFSPFVIKSNLNRSQSLLFKIIQQTEDPTFYSHRGIDLTSIGESIVSNLVKGRLFRGASTITMQLIKNLYLTEDKNLSRKIEELTLALLLENYYAISKQRIAEIYLQIIKFAPGIYGIDNASRFYFDKDYTELTLMECLVMSYILPRPNFFLEAVQSDSEQLKKRLSDHICFHTTQLLFSGIILPSTVTSLHHVITFRKGINTIQLSTQKIKNLKEQFINYENS